MTASYQDIQGFLDRGKKQGATHVIIARDRYDYTNYPVFVMPGEDPKAKVEALRAGNNMQGVDEVYNLSKDIKEQLQRHRCFEF